MHVRAKTTALLSSIALVAACGGSTSTDPAASADSGLTDAGRADSGGKDGGISPACPSAAPDANATCPREELQCEYGDDPRHQCHTIATCRQGKWEVTSPKCAQIPPTKCPATRADAQGKDCSPENALCVYEDGLTCSCTTCPNPYPLCQELKTPVWACQAPNADAECPAARPNLGAACAKEQKKCSYGCEQENNLVCSSGAWQRDPNNQFGCPASTRRVKKDIRYVTTSEAAALAREVDRIKLATYEYTDPALAGPRRLGFIIEDGATTYAVDAEKSQIDLYAYTSTLVAALQAQTKRIEALEREVSTLRGGKRRN